MSPRQISLCPSGPGSGLGPRKQSVSDRDNAKREYSVWINGTYNDISDESAARRKGQLSSLGLGAAFRVSENVAVAGTILHRRGNVDLRFLGIDTDLSALGGSLTTTVALTPLLRLSVTGYLEKGKFDVTTPNSTGKYDGINYGLFTSLSGTLTIDNLMIEPSASYIFTVNDRDGYRDSAGASIPGARVDAHAAKLGINFSRLMVGRGRLIAMKPNFGADLYYSFTDRGGIILGPNNVVNDDRFNLELNAGIDGYFEGGATSSLGVRYSGIGNDGVRVLTINGQIRIPF